MNREARDKRPNLRPVEKIELSEKNLLVRLILVLVLITVAGVAIYFGVNGLLAGNAGWTEIDASSSSQTNCSDEFVFQYEVGTGEKSASVEKKALIQIYSQATETAYQLFQESARFDDVHNVAYINQHPNEEIEVDPDAKNEIEDKIISWRRRGTVICILEPYMSITIPYSVAMICHKQ